MKVPRERPLRTHLPLSQIRHEGDGHRRHLVPWTLSPRRHEDWKKRQRSHVPEDPGEDAAPVGEGSVSDKKL